MRTVRVIEDLEDLDSIGYLAKVEKNSYGIEVSSCTFGFYWLFGIALSHPVEQKLECLQLIPAILYTHSLNINKISYLIHCI